MNNSTTVLHCENCGEQEQLALIFTYLLCPTCALLIIRAWQQQQPREERKEADHASTTR
jgi:multisubunit Na+/H+ antiporter MnhG subunit